MVIALSVLYSRVSGYKHFCYFVKCVNNKFKKKKTLKLDNFQKNINLCLKIVLKKANNYMAKKKNSLNITS